MKGFLDRIPLPAKLFLIGFIPLVVVFYLTFQQYREKTHTTRLLDNYLDRIHQTSDVVNLIDGLQDERSLSVDYTLTGKYDSSLIGVRARNDSMMNVVITGGYDLVQFPSYTFLDNLDSIRAKLDSGQVVFSQAVHYYTTAIFRLNTLNPIPVGAKTYLPSLYSDIASQKLLSELNTYLSIASTNVYTALFTKTYMVETLVGTLGTYQVFKTYEKEFFIKGAPTLKAQYNGMRSRAPLANTISYLDNTFSTFQFEPRYDARQWKQLSSSAIAEVRKLQNEVLVRLEDRLDNYFRRELNAKNSTLILFFIIVVIVTAFVLYTIFSINRALRRLKRNAEQIAEGRPGINLNKVATNDVIGSLAKSIKRIDEKNTELATAAEKIGKGNFDVTVNARSNEDALGTAIATMGQGLQKFTNDLAESVRFNRQLIQSLPIAIYTCNENGEVTLFNKQAAELWGSEPRENTKIYDSDWCFYYPDGQKLPKDEYPTCRVLKGGNIIIEEYILERADGTKRNVIPHVQAIHDSSGVIRGTIVTVLDITENKKVEKDIANLAAIVKFSNDAVVSKSPEGIVTSWNPGAEKVFGYAAEEMVGQSILKIIPDERKNEEPMILARIKRGENVEHFTTVRRHKSGKLINVSVNISPIRDSSGKIIGASKIARDITEEIQAVAKIEESEERLRMAIAATNLGTWDFRPKTGELRWSDQCKAIYGFPPETPVNFNLFEEYMHPDDREYVMGEIAKVMNHQNKEPYDIRFRIFKRDKRTIRWVRGQGKMHFDKNNEPARFVGTVMDITEQIEAQQALEESEQRARLAIDAAKMGTFDWDLLTDKFSSSHRLKEIFGFATSGEITHEEFLSALHPEDRVIRDRAVEKSATTGSLAYEARILWPDKSVHWVKVYGKVTYDEKNKPLRMYGTALDITEEKNILDALKENEERLNIAVQAADLGTWEIDLLTREVHYSDRYLQMLGFAPQEKPSHEELLARIHPEDRDVRNAATTKALQTGMLDYEMRILPAPETVRWIRARGRVFYDDKKTPERMLGIIMDITDEITAFNVLQESEERFKIIANTAPVMIWMSGQDKFSDFFNISWLNFTGRSMAQESGEGWLEGVYPSDRQRCIEVYNEAHEKQKAFSIEYRLRRHDGKYRWISDHAVPRVTPEGKFIGFISACRDIDDEKHYNEKLKASELLFKTITNVSPVALWMTDALGKTNFFNDTWIEWTGMPMEEQYDSGWLNAILMADREFIRKRFQQSFVSRTNFNAEFRIRRKDEKVRWILCEGSPYFDIEGFFAGFAGSMVDITERKEDEMRKNEFLAVASHELKTPLTSIKAYAQLLSRNYKNSKDVFLNSAVSKVETQVNKMSKLVSDFLNLSKIESDKLQLSPQTFTINDLVKEVVEEIQMVSPSYNLSFKQRGSFAVVADREKISQVLANFLNNAIKYSPDDKNIDVEVSKEGMNIRVSVTDRGIGIKPEEHQEIFERFYRSKFNNNISFSGFGIGLYISAEIIRRHNGNIGVESSEGSGSTFYFTLPEAE